jgi:hypothetical protein
MASGETSMGKVFVLFPERARTESHSGEPTAGKQTCAAAAPDRTGNVLHNANG